MADRVIKYTGQFDPNQIIQALRQIQTQMSGLNLGDSLSKGYDKKIDNMVSKANQLKSKIDAGFTSSGQVTTFQKEVDKLILDIRSMGNEFKNTSLDFSKMKLPEDVKNQFKVLDQQAEEYRNTLKQLQDQFKNQAGNLAATSGLGSNIIKASDLTNIGKAVDDAEKLVQLGQQKAQAQQQDIALTKNQSEELKKQVGLEEQKLEALKQSRLGVVSARVQKYEQKEKDGGTLTRGEKGALTKARNEKAALEKASGQTYEQQLKDLERNISSYEKKIDNANKKLKEQEAIYKKIVEYYQILANNAKAGAAGKGDTELAKTAQDAIAAANGMEQVKQKKQEIAQTTVDKTTNEMVRLGQTTKEVGDRFEETSKDINNTKSALQNMESSSKALDQFKDRITYLLSFTNGLYMLRRGINMAKQAINELDAAFTEIAVVTNKTNEELWKSFETYNNMAQKLGITTVDAIKTSALYYQQGLETAEVMTLTAETIKMARIAGMDFEEATNRMTAALRGFNMEMSEASKVNDIFSALAAKSAVDTDELSYALTKTASIAKSAGMDIQTTSAFLSQMIETTREAPENIGTAMKTIIARFQELKKNVGEATEVDGELVDVNKVDTALKSVGINLRDNLTGQFRDLDDVFLELSSKWDTLDRNTQRYVATIAAGSRQQSRFLAMMDNYERTMELVGIAQNSSGESAAQFAKTLDSLDSKAKKIKSSFEELIGGSTTNEFFKWLYDGVNNILQAINNISEIGFPALLAFIVGFAKTLKSSINQVITTSQSLFSLVPNQTKKTKTEYTKALKEANTEIADDLAKKINKATGRKNKKVKVKTTEPNGQTSPASKMSLQDRQLAAAEKHDKWRQPVAALANVGALVTQITAASSSASAAQGSMIGSTTGSAIGAALGSVIPGLGTVLGSAVGNVAGSIIGTFVGPMIDQATYGIGSEEEIKNREEIAKKASEDYNRTVEKNKLLLEQGKVYLDLSEKVNLTTEEVEKLEEAQNALQAQYPTLIEGATNFSEALKNQIKQANEETAKAGVNSAAATAALNYSTAYREFLSSVDDEDIRKYFEKNKDELEKVSYQDFVKQTGSGATLDEYNIYLEAFKTFRASVETETKKVSDSLAETYGLIFDDFDVNSYANKNKELLLGYLKNSIPEIEKEKYLKAGLSGEEITALLELYFPQEKFDQIANRLNSLSKIEQDKFTAALASLGNVDIDILKKNLGDNELASILEDMYNIMSDGFDANWKGLTDEAGKKADEYANNFGTEVAQAFSAFALKFSDDTTMQNGIARIFDSILGDFNSDGKLGENFKNGIKNPLSEVITELNKTDFKSSWSISKLYSELDKIGVESSAVTDLINVMGGTTEKTGLKGKDALKLITKQLEKQDKLLKEMPNALDGSMSLKGFAELQNTLNELELKPIDMSKIFVTEKGIGIEGGIDNYLEEITGKTGTLFEHQAAQAAATRDMYQRELDILRSTTDYQNRKTEAIAKEEELKAKINEYALGEQLYLIQNIQQQIQLQMATAEAERERIRNAKKMIQNLERYYNIERKILDIENRLAQTELDFEIAGTSSGKLNALEGQFKALVDQREMLKKEGQFYEKDLTDLTKTINKKYKDFFTVDDSGVLQYNYQGWKNLAKQIENASDSELEQLEMQQEELKEVKELYEDVYDRVNENTKAQKENTKAIKEYYKGLRENVITVQEKIADSYIKGLEEELEAVKENYAKIKQEDQKYLESLRKNLDKRKQAQQDADAETDIATLRNKIALLGRDTSGIYAKEIQSLQKELAQKEREQQNTQLDRAYESEQERIKAVSEDLTLREKYLTKQLEEEKKSRKETNEFIRAMMLKDEKSLIEYLLSTDKEYLKGTEEQQEKIREETTETVQNAIASQDALELKIEDFAETAKKKYEDTVIDTIEDYLDWIDKANQKELEVRVEITKALQDIKELQDSYTEMMAEMTRHDIEKILTDIESAASKGQNTTVLEKDYERKFNLLKSYDPNTKFSEKGSNYQNYSSTQGSYDYSTGYTLAHKLAAGKSGIKNNNSIYQANVEVPQFLWNEGKYWGGVYSPKDTFRVQLYSDEGDQMFRQETPTLHPDTKYNIYNKTEYDGEVYYAIGMTGHGSNIVDTTNRWIKASDFEKLIYLYGNKNKFGRFATGGIVDYTGPAWVDGTPNKPEAFLSAADTERIAQLRDVLSKIYSPSNFNREETSTSENNGDTYYEFHINVEELGEGYDVERMMKEMEKYILQKANYRKVVNAKRR